MKPLRILGAAGLCLSLFLTTGGGAVNSAPPPAKTITTLTDNVVTDPAPAPDADQVTTVKALTVGHSAKLGTAMVTRTATGFAVAPAVSGAVAADTFCGAALAAAIVGIGAGTLGIIAAMTGGAGTVVIAGMLLTGSEVGILAGFAGSYSAVLGYVSRYIC